MKTRHVLALFLCILLIPARASLQSQQQENPDVCKFTIHESTTKPSITGPEEVVSRVHVIEQPDSPVEIVSVDFAGSWLSVRSNQHSEQLRCKVKIRNRSDKQITAVEGWVSTATQGGGGGYGFTRQPGRWAGLSPGQETDITGCGGGGSGGLKAGQLRVLVGVHWVGFEDCDFFPSMRLPRSLAVGGFRPHWRRL